MVLTSIYGQLKYLAVTTAVGLGISVLLALPLRVLADSDVKHRTITLVADQWCPYNCEPNSDRPGFMIEIAEYAFGEAGFEVAYLNVPWARAINDTRLGEYDGLVGAGREETPDFIFPEHPLGVAAHTFYTPRDSLWRYSGISSLKNVVLGVIKDYSYGDLYQSYIVHNEDNPRRVQVVAGETGLDKNLRKLQAGRISALVEDRNVLQFHLLQTKGYKDITEAGLAYREEVYIAFSPSLERSAVYADILSRALPKLRASGKLEEILMKYGIEDWQ
jgi:polar amino acid transport system substrate-binding protein